MAVLLSLGLGAEARSGPTALFWDDFEAESVGSIPGTPAIGLPWQVSEAVSNGVGVVADPFGSSGKVLQLGLDYNTVVAPLTTTDQSLIAANGNVTLSFQYHGEASANCVSMLDAAGYGPSGSPAFLVRVMPQPVMPTSPLHEVYYLNPTSGLTDSGLAVSSSSWQSLTLQVDLTKRNLQLSVNGATENLPLFTCPNEIVSANFSSYAMGGGAVLGSGLLDNVLMTTDASALTTPSGQTPEPATFSLILAAGLFCVSMGAWTSWKRR
ncbi:MAG: hypothetical protein ABR915_16845 [Thermoguttaceae bacterium]|jgi:hypothetical protein